MLLPLRGKELAKYFLNFSSYSETVTLIYIFAIPFKGTLCNNLEAFLSRGGGDKMNITLNSAWNVKDTRESTSYLCIKSRAIVGVSINHWLPKKYFKFCK